MASLTFLSSFIRIVWVEYYSIFTKRISHYIIYILSLLVVINYTPCVKIRKLQMCSLHWIVHTYILHTFGYRIVNTNE